MTILDEILAHKAVEVARAKEAESAQALRTRAEAACRDSEEGGRATPRGFRRALIDAAADDGIAVIAEVKRRSPSKGLIRADFDPVEIAQAYDDAGAACISVLTDEQFFGGSLDSLPAIRSAVPRPLLRKDFMIDPYQIAEARVAGADAVLLIVSALEPQQMTDLNGLALDYGMDVLVEVHDEAELDRALHLGADLIGVNNRNLATFEVDLGTTERLAVKLAEAGKSDPLLIAESGISNHEDVIRLQRAGATGFLVGESLMRQPDPGQALLELKSPPTTASSTAPPSAPSNAS